MSDLAGLKASLGGLETRQRLEDAFAPWRRRVNGHLVFRAALDGLTLGSVLGAGFTAAAWLTHHPHWRVGGLAIAAAGLAIGAYRGSRRAWSDDQVALYVDGVLGTPESVTSAITLGRAAPEAVVEEAIAALSSPRGARRAPGRLRRLHGLALVGTALCVAALALRVPKPAQAAPPPGTEMVKLQQVPGLDKIAEVEKLPAKDEAQKKRLQEIADEARKLKQRLLEGMPKREALDKIAKLKEKLEAERNDLGQGDKKPGLDAAAGALKAGGFPGLADALEDRDLAAFDEMMERIANEREEADKEKAKEALEKAIAEAKKKGADDVAKRLEKQKEKLEKRKDKADALRELSKGLEGTPHHPGKAEKNFDDKATDDAAKQLADSLKKGLEKLTPEERKKLADKLREKAEQGGSNGKMSPKAKQKLKEWADKLKTPEGQKELEDELKKEANEDGSGGKGDDEKREEGLDDAQDGADDAGDGLGDQDGKGKDGKGKGGKGKDKDKDGKNKDGKGKDGKGKDGNGKDGKDGKDKDGKDGNGNGKDGKDGNGDGKDGNGKDGNGKDGNGSIDLGNGDGGEPGGGGDGDHKGKSKNVDSSTLKAKAKGKGSGDPHKKPVGSETSSGSDGSKSTVKGTGNLGGATAGDLNSIDKADVPEAVRRQVKSYFE